MEATKNLNNKLEYSQKYQAQQLMNQNQINANMAYRMQFGCNPNDLASIKNHSTSSSATFGPNALG